MKMTDKSVKRFWAKVNKTDSCWLWKGAINKCGYGSLTINGKDARAHRVAFLLSGKIIPINFVLDHICKVRHCVNPGHLEPVTIKENILRGMGLTANNSRKTHCLKGHLLAKENLYLYKNKRGCRMCRKISMEKYKNNKSFLVGGTP